MRETKPLEEYADIIFDHRNDPHTLAELALEMSVKCAYIAEGYKPIKLAKATYWKSKYQDEKPKSETFMETQWDVSDMGLKEIRMKIEIEGLDRLIQACKSMQIEHAREAKNI